MQFKQRHISRPIMMMLHDQGGLRLEFVHMDQQFGGRLLQPNDELLGRWTDIVMHIRWSIHDDGFTRVYINGDLRLDRPGPQTLYSDPFGYRYGIYRSFISRYERMHNERIPTQVLYFDHIRRGHSYRDVQPPEWPDSVMDQTLR